MTGTKEEASAYAKGYTAGRRRKRLDMEREIAAARRERFRQEAALVALPLIASGRWGTTAADGTHKPYRTMSEYAKAAFSFADHMLKHTYFPVEPSARPNDGDGE